MSLGESECPNCGRLLDEFSQCWACDAADGAPTPAADLTLNAASLRDASLQVMRCTGQLEVRTRVASASRFDLDLAEAHLLAAGVEGRNEAERKANLRLQLAEHYHNLRDAEAGVSSARHDLEIARAWLDALRYQLRLLEVQTGSRA